MPRFHLQNGGFQEFIENADTASFDEQVRIEGFLKRSPYCALIITRINDHFSPGWRIDVAVLLPVVSVRFVEGNAMTAGGKRSDNSAIVGCGTIPICGDQT